MLLASTMTTWVVWLIIGTVILFVYRPALLPAAVIFGIGLGFGWW